MERVATNEHRHVRAVVREVQHDLAHRVPDADHDHALSRRLRELAPTSAVVHAVSDELVDAGKIDPAPFDAGRGKNDRSRHLNTIVEDQPNPVTTDVQATAL